jgi:hypothetical protein
MYAAVPKGIVRESRTGRTGSAARGARTASARHRRIASTPLGWAIEEMTAALPTHFLHPRTSSRKTRLINSAQESLLSRSLGESPGATSKVGTVTRCAGRQPLALPSGGGSVRGLLSARVRSRTTVLRHFFAPGASMPWSRVMLPLGEGVRTASFSRSSTPVKTTWGAISPGVAKRVRDASVWEFTQSLGRDRRAGNIPT